MKAKITKKYKILYWIFSILSFISIIFPVAFYVVKGYVESSVVTEKVTLTCTLLIAIILTIVNILFKKRIRSIIWIILIGIYICIDNILVMILLIAIGTILDEFIFTPLKLHYKNKHFVNKEIDKRL